METCQVPNFFEGIRTCFPTYPDRRLSCKQMTINGLDADIRPYVIAALILLGLFDVWERDVIHSYRSARDIIWHGFICILVTVSGYMNKWGLAVAMAVFAMTWVRLPINQSNTGGALPSFSTFIKSLPNTKSPPDDSATWSSTDMTKANVAVEELNCIVCWSSETSLKVLPCKHIICSDCLMSISASTQNHCPLCRLPLFVHSDSFNATICRAAAAVWNADAAMGLLIVAVHLRHRKGWTFDLYFHGGRALYQILHALFGRYIIRQTGGDWWRTSIFSQFQGPWWVIVSQLLTLTQNLLMHIWELERENKVATVCTQ